VRWPSPTSAVLTDDKATESAVKAQMLGDFDVLHFAFHAFADRNSLNEWHSCS
jgi:hypothetical protein